MEAQDKQLRLGWLWDTPDRWAFHRTIKFAVWDMLKSRKIDLKTLIAVLQVKEEWLEIRPDDKIVINYPMFLFIYQMYMKVYKKFGPSLLYRLGIKKVCIFILTLFREDSAYSERIGGFVQYILTHSEDWPSGDKEARLLALQDLKQWWYEEDWRQRNKEDIAAAFDWIIDKYDKDEFVRKSIDFWIDNFLINKERWNDGDGFFTPEHWYPRGKGQANYLCHGRLS